MGGSPKIECIHSYFQRAHTVDPSIRKNVENMCVVPFVQLEPVDPKTSNPVKEATEDATPAPADVMMPGKLLTQQE